MTPSETTALPSPKTTPAMHEEAMLFITRWHVRDVVTTTYATPYACRFAALCDACHAARLGRCLTVTAYVEGVAVFRWLRPDAPPDYGLEPEPTP
ncbi:MAG: hypothetical protein AAF612_10375 [Planctomycetota bacterium]